MEPEKKIVLCPHCNRPLRVPVNKGVLNVGCPHCKNKFQHNSGSPVVPKGTILTCPNCGKSIKAPATTADQSIACGCGYFLTGPKKGQMRQGVKPKYPPKTEPIVNPNFNGGAKVPPKPKTPPKPKESPVTTPGFKPGDPVKTPPKSRVRVETKVASNPPPKTTPTPKTPPKPKSTVTRKLVIERLFHAHKGLDMTGIANFFKDDGFVNIYLDDQLVGKPDKKHPVVNLTMDGNRHEIRNGMLGAKHHIPAGTGDYMGYFFNNSFDFAPVEDPFRDALGEFLLKVFRGQGIRERMLDPNNRYGNVMLTIQSDRIVIARQLYKTKGLSQWSTGGDEEKIFFSQIGISPLPQEKLPAGYWQFINRYMLDLIASDPEADMERGGGGANGIRPRTRHSLY